MTTQAQREAMRRYYHKNKEKMAAYNKAYREKNRTKKNERARRKTRALRDIEQWNRDNHQKTTMKQWLEWQKLSDI